MASLRSIGPAERRARGVLSAALAVLGAVAALLAILVVYIDRTTFDSDSFADRATAALEQPATRDAVSLALSDAIIEENPDLIPSRPAIEFASGAIIGSSSFEAIFRRAVAETHRVFFEEEGSVVLQLGDVGQLVTAVVGASNPEIAEQLPPELETGLITISERDFATETLAIAEGVSLLSFILPAIALVLIGAAFLVAVARRRAVVIIGLVLALVLGVGLVVINAVRGAIANGFVDGAAARAVWDAFLGDLNTVLWLILAGCVVVAASAASLVFHYDLPALGRRFWVRVSTPPEGRLWRALWALAIVLVGIFVALDPLSALTLTGVVAGVLLLFFGASQLMGVIDEQTGERSAREARGAFSGLVRGAIAAVVAVGLVVAGTLLIGGSDAADAAQEIEVCNGHVELCDTPVSAVSMAGTHNSMSAAQEGFNLSMHDGGIIAQLDGGIRALLIDTWYGIPKSNFVLTDLPASGVSEEEQAEVYGQAALDAAARLRGGADGDRESQTYMCHGFCELGALPLADELTKIRDWMDAHPNDVIVIVVQDAISPADTVAAFDTSGLLDLVYHHTPGQPFPTLREMIASGERVVVMAEKITDPAIDWYLQAYDYTQETPFRALTPGEFTCRADRGGTGKPFFLLNHWIEKTQPSVEDAQVVNAREFLLSRARECETTRGVTPGIVADNYWGVGDVVAVVDELNGVVGTP